MTIEILMPALSPTMEEGTLAKWLVKPGDTVKSGDLLAEIETDKATMEFEAVDEGVIGELLVAEGTEGVKVNAPIATLLAEVAARRVPEALAEHRRKRRAEQVVARSRAVGFLAHGAHPATALLRDVLALATPARVALRQAATVFEPDE